MKSSKSSGKSRDMKERIIRPLKMLRKKNVLRRKRPKRKKGRWKKKQKKLISLLTSIRISSTLFMKIFLTSTKRSSITPM